jgi:hypothetical protein
MSAARAVTATFVPTYVLTVSKSGTGTGTVTSSPAGINCGADCTETYNDASVVALTPSASAGSAFTVWSGACTGSGACNVTMSAARSVTATFAPAITYSGDFVVNVASTSGGPQCTAWDSFRGSLSAADNYTRISMSSTIDAVGKTCTGANANTLCQGLRTGTAVPGLVCDGNTWNVYWSSPTVELTADQYPWSCNSSYSIRACIGNANWGGVGSASCSGPTQTINVACYR